MAETTEEMLAAHTVTKILYIGPQATIPKKWIRGPAVPFLFTDRPRSFFVKLDSAIAVVPTDEVPLVQISIIVQEQFNILELLATFSFQNPAADDEVEATFVLRDSDGTLLNIERLRAKNNAIVAGSLVFRGELIPGPHVFSLFVSTPGPGSIVIDPATGDNASLFIQQLDR